jgi:hypothetical protein
VYKHAFRRVIARELEKDGEIRGYFDTWGSRCYLLSSELKREFLCHKGHRKREVENLQIDTELLGKMGARYVISAVRIVNHRSLGLRLEKVFERNDSPWQIYLYSIERQGGRGTPPP